MLLNKVVPLLPHARRINFASKECEALIVFLRLACISEAFFLSLKNSRHEDKMLKEREGGPGLYCLAALSL